MKAEFGMGSAPRWSERMGVEGNRAGGGRLVALGLIVGFGLFFSICLGVNDRIGSASRSQEAGLTRLLDPDSPSGYARGLRWQLLEPNWDGYQWIQHAQRAAELGVLRLRETDIDNAPEGRAVHWSQSVIWTLRAVGWVHALIAGIPHAAGIEAAAIYTMPAMFLPLVIALTLVVWKRLGEVAAAVFGFALFGCSVFSANMGVGQMDHHGLVGFAVLGSSLFLALAYWPLEVVELRAAWIRERERWIVASALAGSAGLWISASSTIPFVAASGVGLLGAGLIQVGASADPAERAAEARLLRLWGRAGALGSVAFYLIEYFPDHLALRLEVNHPAYAVAWWAGAELIARILEWRAGVTPWATVRRGATCLLLAGGSLLPAVLILMGGSAVFAPADGFLSDLHRIHIQEFQRMRDMIARNGLLYGVLRLGCPVGALILLLIAFECRRSAAIAFLMTPPIGVFFTMTGQQVRWAIIANALAIAILPVGLALAFKRGRCLAPTDRWRSFIAGGVAAVLVLGMLVFEIGRAAWAFRSRCQISAPVGEMDQFTLASRAIAHLISERMPPGQRPVVLSSPSMTLTLSYFGGARGIGTYYWENADGLRQADELFLAGDEESFRAGIKARGITHLVLPLKEMSYLLSDGLGGSARFGMGSGPSPFLRRVIQDRALPQWLSPVAFRRPPLIENDWAAIIEVRLGQSEAGALLAWGEYELDLGRVEEARKRFAEALSIDPASAMAHLRLASLLTGEPEMRAAVATAAAACEGEQLAKAVLDLALESRLPGPPLVRVALEECLKKTPGHPELRLENALVILSEALYGKGQSKAAAAAAASALLDGLPKMEGRSGVRRRVADGLVLAAEGLRDEAESALSQAYSESRRSDLTIAERLEIVGLLAEMRKLGKP